MGIEILQEEDDVFVHDEDVWIGKKTHVEGLFQKEQMLKMLRSLLPFDPVGLYLQVRLQKGC